MDGPVQVRPVDAAARVPPGFETFNYHALEGKDLTAQVLTETAEAMPMMAERTLTVVTDWDLFNLGDGFALGIGGNLLNLRHQARHQGAAGEDQVLRRSLEDLPPYGCIVFVYDTLEYKPNRTMKKLCKALES